MRRWPIPLLCFSATAINYLDRANLGVAVPILEKTYHLSPAVMGLLLSGFFWSYIVMQLPAGRLIDRYGPRRVYTAAALIWSIATAAMAGTSSVAGIFLARLGLGVGESFCYPLNAKITALWFERRERGFVTGFWASGARVGSALALPIVAFLITHYGWRVSFVASGVLGLLWLLAWLAYYRDPPQPAVARGMGAPVQPPVRWSSLFRYRTIWGMMIGFFCLNFNIYFFTTWFPTFLMQAHGLSLARMGTLGLIPGLVAIPAGWLGGFLSDALQRFGFTPTTARKGCLVGGLLASSIIVVPAILPSIAVTIACMSISYAGLAFAGAVVWTLPGEVAPHPDQVASIASIQNLASNFAGILLTTFTGVMLTFTRGSFVVPLIAAAGFCIVGALSYLFLVGPIEPLPPLLPSARMRGTLTAPHHTRGHS